MKTALLILTLLLSFSAQAQDGYFNPLPYQNQPTQWESRWDTSVIAPGKPDCEHNWVGKPDEPSVTFCAVLHDARGCPDHWGRVERICSRCLRKEIIQEERFFPQKELDRVDRDRKKREEYRRLDSLVSEKLGLFSPKIRATEWIQSGPAIRTTLDTNCVLIFKK